MPEKDKSAPEETEPILEIEQDTDVDTQPDEEATIDTSLEKAIEMYRKIREQNGPLSEK